MPILVLLGNIHKWCPTFGVIWRLKINFEIFQIGFQHRKSKLIFRNWSLKLIFEIDLQNWSSKLTLKIDLQNWSSNLIFKIDLQIWSSKLIFKSDLQNWSAKLIFIWCESITALITMVSLYVLLMQFGFMYLQCIYHLQCHKKVMQVYLCKPSQCLVTAFRYLKYGM